jgi:hypothetical protein
MFFLGKIFPSLFGSKKKKFLPPPAPVFVENSVKEIVDIPIPEPEIDWETPILEDWNSIPWPTTYFGNEEAAALVDDFKSRLIKKYNMKYLSSGGTSNVYFNMNKKFVVKISQVFGAEPADFSNYIAFAKNQYVLREDLPVQDAINWLEIQKLKHAHVLFPHKYGNNMLLCIQEYIEQDDYCNRHSMNYFDNILGNYQLTSLRKRIGWRDIAPINNIAWCYKTKKPYIIDL